MPALPDENSTGHLALGASLELEAEFSEELDGRIDVLHPDTDVDHPLDCHEGLSLSVAVAAP